MSRVLRGSAIYALLAFCTLSTFAQYGPLVGTVVDVDAGRGRIMIELDNAEATRVTIETDSVATAYHGFGTMIAGKPEVFVGSQGLSNVRAGDRIDVRGPMKSENLYRADRVTLVGRDVEAPTVGVGQTRPPTSVNVPNPSTPAPTVSSGGTAEGVIRQINADDGRIVLESNRLMITVRTFRNTPVYYRGEVYRVANLEVGDTIRVEADPRDAQADDITARRIDVVRSVQESGGTTGGTAVVTVLEGRVARVEPGLDYIYVEDDRSEVRVDMRQAQDVRGDVLRARDVRVGEMVEITGSFNRVGDMFLASTVRFGSGTGERPYDRDSVVRYGLVTLTGTITETLEDGATLGFRDRDTNQVVRIWVADDFVVRTKGTTYTTAGELRVNDTVVVDAFRDDFGNLIAQTIRLRNR
jgi:hypothetical protein